MVNADYLIVGSGLTGATIARLLKDAGKDVVVLERRGRIGGNVVDSVSSDIRVNTYGPHYFRTNAKKIWDFASRFTPFGLYSATILTRVRGENHYWPIQKNYIDRRIGKDWKPKLGEDVEVTNFEEACLSRMPERIYKEFIKGYTEKQWGVPATSLSKELACRFEVREDGDIRLYKSLYQGLPIQGYSQWMTNLLDGIPTITACDYLKHRTEFKHKSKLIFTGPIDEYFDFNLGRLKYRSQHRTHTYYGPKDYCRTGVEDYYQEGVQINYPASNIQHIRSIEWKHLPYSYTYSSKKDTGTVLTLETPYTATNPDEYEYPFPSDEMKTLYNAYLTQSMLLKDVVFCGRLGSYRYLDMDQAIAQGMTIAKHLLKDS